MPKYGRILLENAFYHVMSRGNQKQVVFKDNADFEKYLHLLMHYKRKYRFRLYAWCLMPNHVHLILDIDETIQLSKIMQGINLAYALWFNKKYGKVGHLWQGRFKNKNIQKNQYILDCINYIETNPIRSKMINNPLDYRWSSYRYRTSGDISPLLDPITI